MINASPNRTGIYYHKYFKKGTSNLFLSEALKMHIKPLILGINWVVATISLFIISDLAQIKRVVTCRKGLGCYLVDFSLMPCPISKLICEGYKINVNVSVCLEIKWCCDLG